MSIRLAVSHGAYWPMIGHILSVIGQFLILKIIAVEWGAELFGKFSLVLATVAAVNIIFIGPLTQWALRDYQGAMEAGNLREYFKVIQNHVLISALLILLLAFFVISTTGQLLSSHLGIGIDLFLYSVILGVGVSLNNLIFTLLNASMFPGKSAVLSIIDILLRIAVLLIIQTVGYKSLIAFVLGLIIIQCSLLLYGYIYLVSIQKNSSSWGYSIRSSLIVKFRVDMTNYAWPFLLWGAFGYVANMGDKWVVGTFVSSSELGIYSAMILATMGVTNAISVAINKGIMPVVFRISGENVSGHRSSSAASFVNALILVLTVIFSIMIVSSYLFPEQIIILLASSEFTSHASFLWMLMLAASAYNISQFLIIHGLIKKNPSIYLPIKLFHSAIILIALLYLVPDMGIRGAAYALLLGNLLHLLMVWLLNRRVIIE